jgi:hypothetical protein
VQVFIEGVIPLVYDPGFFFRSLSQQVLPEELFDIFCLQRGLVYYLISEKGIWY